MHSPAEPRDRTSDNSITGVRPVIVIIAGVPRSGSTWLYNAARLICEAAELDVHACWVADYDPAAHAGSDIHLVKLHHAKHLTFPHHRLLTTRRNLEERLASLLRMGWIGSAPEAILEAAKGQASLYAYWNERADLEIAYDEIEKAPADAVERIAEILRLPLRSSDRDRISKALTELPGAEVKKCTKGYNETTLLHPGHRADKAGRDKALRHVRAVLAKDRP